MFFNVYLFWIQERDRAQAGEGQRHRIWSRLQALSSQHRATWALHVTHWATQALQEKPLLEGPKIFPMLANFTQFFFLLWSHSLQMKSQIPYICQTLQHSLLNVFILVVVNTWIISKWPGSFVITYICWPQLQNFWFSQPGARDFPF